MNLTSGKREKLKEPLLLFKDHKVLIDLRKVQWAYNKPLARQTFNQQDQYQD